MYFASDNTAGIAPPILEAIARANTGYALGYGNDEWTRRVEQRFAAMFEREVAVFLVPTGTAANALALAHVTPPWGAVLCHAGSHIATDECGAPEFFGGGIKLVGLGGEGAKISAATLRTALDGPWGGPHHVSPAALSLSQATECGTIYRVAEIRELADIARSKGAVLHMDGARIGNALARMNVSAAEVTWKAGVDVLSFGATKGGAMGVEAVIFFDPKRAANMQDRRKRGGALASKHRFIAAQMEAYLDGDLWLTLARHAGVASRGERSVRADSRGGRQEAESGGRDVLSVAGRRPEHRRRQGAGASRDVVPDHAGRRRQVPCHRPSQVTPKVRPIPQRPSSAAEFIAVVEVFHEAHRVRGGGACHDRRGSGVGAADVGPGSGPLLRAGSRAKVAARPRAARSAAGCLCGGVDGARSGRPAAADRTPRCPARRR
jgi:threonine aldolase